MANFIFCNIIEIHAKVWHLLLYIVGDPAYARFYNGDIKGAGKDLKHAFQLNPRDPRLQELQDHIQQADQQ